STIFGIMRGKTELQWPVASCHARRAAGLRRRRDSHVSIEISQAHCHNSARVGAGRKCTADGSSRKRSAPHRLCRCSMPEDHVVSEGKLLRRVAIREWSERQLSNQEPKRTPPWRRCRDGLRLRLERRKTSDGVQAAGRAARLFPPSSHRRIATAGTTRQRRRPDLFYDLEIDRVRLVPGCGGLPAPSWFRCGTLPSHRHYRPKLACARAAKGAIPEDEHGCARD